ncbi:MAG: glycoside hydrolase family 38 C-terminal domain-containing protein [Anaerolineae bacterium]|nr:glycoside hydrolase family 38 C-terminal domain-containing protein [Anaerolineae bacterium]
MGSIAVVDARETIFFGRHGERLCQWVTAVLESRLEGPLPGTVTITAAGQAVETSLRIEPGVQEYRCYAPVLWPDHPPLEVAPLRVEVGGEVASASVAVGHHRPWTVYVLADDCTDYTWVYSDEAAMRADDAELTEAELRLCEATAGAPEGERNRYNLAVARQVEFYLERFPRHRERLFEHIRRGDVTLNPLFNMCLTGDMSLEELIRQLYPARNWARDEGLDIGCANHQETPAITWAMATVLAGCGIRHLVKGNLPYECPWASRYEEPPVFLWEGPDGSQVLYRRRNEDYVEAGFLLRDLRATNSALHERILPEYERLGERYPLSAIALVGCYGDLSAQTRELGARKAANISAYNAQGWEYPRLVSASHRMFWADLEAQRAARGLELPAYRGDYGGGWEAWPASLARDFAGWRRAQERAGMADRLMAILSRLDPGWWQSQRQELERGWMSLIYLADHAWNGANEANRALNARLRRQWQVAANEAFDRVVVGGLARLAGRVPTGATAQVLVFNGLPWQRSALAKVHGLPAGSRLLDLESGEEVPTQACEQHGEPALAFVAGRVPSVGYRAFRVEPAPNAEARAGPFVFGANRLEGPFYTVEISPVTGGITSLYDKVRRRELVDAASPYHLNQCMYLSEGVEHSPRAAEVQPGACGPVFAELVVRARLKNTALTSTITLYGSLDRVDIRNEVEKLPTSERQELDFAFPFDVPGRRYRYEAPGAIIDPDADLLPGAGLAALAVRHFVDVFNDEFGVTLSQADTGIIEFGRRTTGEDPLALPADNATILAMALDNCLDWHEAIRDQAGERHFVFRYALRGHGPGFDPVAAVHLGWEDNNELEALLLPAGQEGDLPAPAHSFVQTSPDSAILTCLKAAEEEGLIARLWNCSRDELEARVDVSGLGRLAGVQQTDHLERGGQALAAAASGAVTLRAHGLVTLRLCF